MRLVLAAAVSFLIAASATAAPVAPGFNSNTLGPSDDGIAGPIALGFSVNFFGTTYTNTYVNNNGFLTFGGAVTAWTPVELGAGYSGLPIIAPFFADVDTTGANSGHTSFGTGTYAGHAAFGVTWPSVGYFNIFNDTDKLNTFQVILTDRSDTGAGNFDIYFNYDSIQWEAGDASDGIDGLGGTSAAAGFNAGTGNAPGTFYEISGSLENGAFLDGGPIALTHQTNENVPGQFLIPIRNDSGVPPPPTTPVPEPATLLLMGAGLAALAGMRRKGLI